MRGISKIFLSEVRFMKNFMDKPITWKTYTIFTVATVLLSTIVYVITWTDLIDRVSFEVNKIRSKKR